MTRLISFTPFDRWRWLRTACNRAAFGICLFGLPGLAAAQGTVIFHNTGGGQPLITEVRSIFLDSTLQQPQLLFDFGFATDESSGPGTFLDSFTISIQDQAQRFNAVYLTADATGLTWAPATPGSLFIDPASISWTSIAYPGLQPSLTQRNAFQVTAPIPPQFLGSSINVFFDLFDNQDSTISQGWFNNLGVTSVPEPQASALFIVGMLVLLGWRRRN